jgi:hypothetical protein
MAPTERLGRVIIKRGNRFNVRLWIPDPTAKPGRRLHWVGSYDTRKEARKAEAEATLKIISRPQGQRAWTIEQFYERWLIKYHGPNTRRGDKTLKHNREAMKNFLRDHGSRRLDAYGPDEARDFAAEFSWQARVASAFFSDAVRDGKLDVSPFRGLTIKRGKGRKHIDPLTMSEVDRLAQIAETTLGFYGPHFAAFIRIAGWTGNASRRAVPPGMATHRLGHQRDRHSRHQDRRRSLHRPRAAGPCRARADRAPPRPGVPHGVRQDDEPAQLRLLLDPGARRVRG